jgi:hypothetical protein
LSSSWLQHRPKYRLVQTLAIRLGWKRQRTQLGKIWFLVANDVKQNTPNGLRLFFFWGRVGCWNFKKKCVLTFFTSSSQYVLNSFWLLSVFDPVTKCGCSSLVLVHYINELIIFKLVLVYQGQWIHSKSNEITLPIETPCVVVYSCNLHTQLKREDYNISILKHFKLDFNCFFWWWVNQRCPWQKKKIEPLGRVLTTN